MSKREKLFAKILRGASNKSITFDEAVCALEESGFARDGGKGSHQVFRHKDGRKMVLPRHGKEIKPIYVKLIRKLIS